MRFTKDRLNYILLFIISLILVLDLFIHQGQQATFDGPTHITTIAQFYRALSTGEFPVQWAGGFANYGLPTPLIVHQTTNYLGGFLSFFTHTFILSFSIIVFIAAFFSA